MVVSVFGAKEREPGEEALMSILAESAGLWTGLKRAIVREYGRGGVEVHFQWKFYGVSSGWVVKAVRRDRTLFYMVPAANSVETIVVFGRAAADDAERPGAGAPADAPDDAMLPDTVLDAIREAPEYVEGRSFRVPVASPEDIELVLRLVRIKLGAGPDRPGFVAPDDGA
ncbi:hypothetical protein GCM10022198_02990 [Klugiella xanthotipulae]|uniref:Uncharacterized protein DUF3788 n=1 Tax=Klugiella xanthotipulae TaxID=244735 RepID=A0A543I727_9MICO|nr:DUF3788 family protein [Klugiella xanthotipulae]TQM66404.1 uncharacterized protein DUF3788 [Klugiella xanthotipulae]